MLPKITPLRPGMSAEKKRPKFPWRRFRNWRTYCGCGSGWLKSYSILCLATLPDGTKSLNEKSSVFFFFFFFFWGRILVEIKGEFSWTKWVHSHGHLGKISCSFLGEFLWTKNFHKNSWKMSSRIYPFWKRESTVHDNPTFCVFGLLPCSK